MDSETNLCKIYESRPLICRVDEVHKKLYSHIPLKEFYAKNAEVCNALQEANHMDISLGLFLINNLEFIAPQTPHQPSLL